MSRALTAGMSTAVAGEKANVVRLIQIEHGGGTLRLATSSQDLSWDSQTWLAIGGVLRIGAAEEVPDLRGAGMPVEMAGVDGTLVAVIMTNDFRGHEVLVYRAHIAAAGTIVADPYLEFRGYQNGTYRVVDNPKAEDGGGGTVTVKTRWVSRLIRLQTALAARTNLHSHRDLLRRAGLAGTDLDDDIFKFLPGLAARVSTIRWGAALVAPYDGSGGGHKHNPAYQGQEIPHAL